MPFLKLLLIFRAVLHLKAGKAASLGVHAFPTFRLTYGVHPVALLYVRLIRIALASLVLAGFWYLMKFDIGLILISVVGVPLALHIVTAPLLTVVNVINDRITMKGFGRQFTQQLEQELRS